MIDVDPLQEAKLRIKRALEHLDSVRKEVAAYLDDRPYVPVVKDEAELQRSFASGDLERFAAVEDTDLRHRWVNLVATEVRPLPDAIALGVGDFLHQLRASLDSLAWRIVERESTESPVGWQNKTSRQRATHFPIFEPRKGADADGRHRRLLEPFTTDAIETVLDRLQPYHSSDPARHPLAEIRRLNDTDKHQMLHPLAQTVGGAARFLCRFPSGWIVGQEASSIGIYEDGVLRQFRLEDGATVGYLRFSDAVRGFKEREGHVHVECTGGVTVSLDEPGTVDNPARPLVEHLDSLLLFVRDEVVERFAPVFEGGDPLPVAIDADGDLLMP